MNPSSRTVSVRGAAVRGCRAAFTLVEIMVSISVVSLIVAAVIPGLASTKRRTMATTIANDLRTFAAAFDTYAHESGGWPAEVVAGVLPPELSTRINSTNWLRVTPIGGQYNWDKSQTHYGTTYRAVIAISTTAAHLLSQDLELWEEIDRQMDDGNLMTGNFRLGADDEPIFIVTP